MKLTKKEQLALKKFKAAVEAALHGQLAEIRLFGSKARGDARKDSDIDVLVITSRGDWRLRDVVYRVATDILIETEVSLSPKVISQNDYDRMNRTGSEFIRNVIHDGISL